MLNVIENGRRIETPWHAVFPPRATERTTPSAEQQPISNRDQTRESTLPHASVGKKTYQRVEHAAEERQKVSIAKEIMSAGVITLPGHTDLLFAWSEFQKHRIRHIPIVDGEKELLGIISDRDILKAWANMASEDRHTIESLTVREIMKVRVLTGTPTTNIREIADAMTVHRIGAIPLLDEKKHIIGIVTRSDILRTIVHQAPLDLWS